MKKKIALVSMILILALVCATVLAACGPASDPSKAKEKLEKNGYTVMLDSRVQPAALKLAGINGVDTVLEASYSKDGNSEFLTVLYFTSSSAAKDAWDAAKKEDLRA